MLTFPRYNAELPFPLLDSFPDRLFTLHPASGGLDIDAAIMSTSRTKSHVLGLRDAVTRLLDIDERETMYNDLTEMANNYSFGFDSDSNDEDD